MIIIIVVVIVIIIFICLKYQIKTPEQARKTRQKTAMHLH